MADMIRDLNSLYAVIGEANRLVDSVESNARGSNDYDRIKDARYVIREAEAAYDRISSEISRRSW